MINVGFGCLIAVALGVGASVLITRASNLRPVVAMLLALGIVLTIAAMAITLLWLRF